MNYSELLQLTKGWGNFKFYRVIIWRLRSLQVEKEVSDAKIPALRNYFLPLFFLAQLDHHNIYSLFLFLHLVQTPFLVTFPNLSNADFLSFFKIIP